MFLGDLIINHDSRRIPLSSKQRENIEKKYPYYGAQGIIDYVDDYLFDGEYLLIAEDGENLRSRKKPIASIIKGKFWVNNHAHVVTAKKHVNLHFLCLWMNSSDISKYVTGSAQPKLSQGNMNAIQIPDFSKGVQDKIAKSLSGYEDKINANLSCISTLENIAVEIYKKLFIRSNLEDMYYHEGCAGSGGWTKSNVFEQIAEVKDKNQMEKGYPVLSVVKEGEFKASKDIFSKQVYSKSTKNYKIVRRGQVAYNPARANIGSIAMLKDWEVGLVSPIYIVFEMKQTIMPVFFDYYMKQPIFLEMIKHHAIGTTRQNFPLEAFQMFPMAVPPMRLQVEFERLVEPMERKIAKLKEENVVLKKIRDTLLPRLMSGELMVKGDDE